MDKKAKILCIDDEEEVTEFLHDYFREKGYEPYRTKSGEIGLELVRKHNPDIVLLDVRIPGSVWSDGVEILKEIKKINSAIRVIMVTGVSDNDTVKRAMEIGASGYITKPLSLDYLEGEVMEKIKGTLSGESETKK